MKKTILFCAGFAFFVTISNSQTVTDYDGNIYNTVTIGTQVWTKENLNVKHYLNGDAITEVKDSIPWVNQTMGAWCYNENNPGNGAIYGALYNWYAVNDPRKIAPEGWHVPTDAEWKILEITVGMSPATADLENYRGVPAANALKEAGTTTHWTLDCCPGHVPNAGTNSSGFTALGGGFRWYFNAGASYRTFSPPTGNAQFWTSTAPDDSTAWLRHLCVYHEDIYRVHWKKTNGSSIRLVKNKTTEINEGMGQMQINVNPIPAIDNIYINAFTNQKIKMQVYNIIGECVLQKDLSNSINEIDISCLTKGIYIMKFTSPNGSMEKKLIKE